MVVLAACGGSAATPVAPPVTPAASANGHVDADPTPIDPIAALTPATDGDVSWLVPGHAQLEVGSPPIEAAPGAVPIAVTIIEQHGNLVRVAVSLPHARFSLWTDRARMLALVRRDQRVSESAGRDTVGDMQVVLRAGARVKRLAHKGAWTQVRYVGAFEVEGWIPDGALGDAGPHHDATGRIPSGQRTLMVTPGAVIRAEPTWVARELGVVATANGYFLDQVKELDPAWVEVAYADGDVVLHGYYSRRDPPGRVHHLRADPEVVPVPITPNGKVSSGTCLYARQGGDAIGYIVGDRDVDLEDAGKGWWTLAIDTPWGAITFGARGPARAELVACAPAGTVPPPAPPAPALSFP
jgi:hypothetical protein